MSAEDDWELETASLNELRGFGLHESRVRAAQLAIQEPLALAALVDDLQGAGEWKKPTTIGALLEAGLDRANLAALGVLLATTTDRQAVVEAVSANLRANGSWCRALDADGPRDLDAIAEDSTFYAPIAELHRQYLVELQTDECEAAPAPVVRTPAERRAWIDARIDAQIEAEAAARSARAADRDQRITAACKSEAAAAAKGRAPVGVDKLPRRGISNPARGLRKW